MPVLPTSLLIAAAADSRTLDSRGARLGDAVERVAQSLSTPVKRAAALLRRQNDAVCSQGYIAGCYQGLNAGPSAGAIVGIVLGSIAGFLFILWLLWILSNGTTFIRTSNLVEDNDVVISRRRERSHRSHSPRSTRRSTYQAEMRHSSSRPERIIRQERIVRDVPPPRVDGSRVRETVIVEESRPERRVDGDDIIEVMEEHSSIGEPPPRRKSRRSSGFR